MPIIERDVVLQSKDGDGNQTMDFPVTRLGLIEDTADVKETPAEGDYIALMDGAEDGQMKKAPLTALRKVVRGYVFAAGTTPPEDTGLLWIDTTASTGGLKYYNGSAWVHVPVAYT